MLTGIIPGSVPMCPVTIIIGITVVPVTVIETGMLMPAGIYGGIGARHGTIEATMVFCLDSGLEATIATVLVIMNPEDLAPSLGAGMCMIDTVGTYTRCAAKNGIF